MTRPDPATVLRGKTAIVTGASSGIGRATAEQLIEIGVRVALVGRNEGRLRAAAQHWPSALWLPLECDVRSDPSVREMVAAAEHHFGQVDILVNSAGVFKVLALTELTNEAWQELWETNVNGTVFPTRAVLPGMLKRATGYIVIVSSVAAHRGYANMTGYGATKHAVTGFGRALTTEVRRSGIRVINVASGPVDTPIWDGLNEPLPRAEMLTADEVATAIINAMTISNRQVTEDVLLLPQGGLYF